MFLGKQKHLEDQILSKLKDGPLKTVDLLESLKPATKQGMYHTLRNLNQEEVIILNKKTATLNTLWIKKLDEYIKTAKHNYWQQTSLPCYFTNLEDGDKIQYHFKNPKLMDSFWGHVLLTLLQTTPRHAHDFVYAPHYWFFLARRETEIEFYNTFPDINKYAFISVSGHTFLDKQFIKEQVNHHVQQSILSKPLSAKNNYYLNIIADYIVEAYIDAQTANEIDLFYQHTNHLPSPHHIDQLKHIIEQPGKNKFIISKNASRAARLRNKLIKNFYIPNN